MGLLPRHWCADAFSMFLIRPLAALVQPYGAHHERVTERIAPSIPYSFWYWAWGPQRRGAGWSHSCCCVSLSPLASCRLYVLKPSLLMYRPLCFRQSCIIQLPHTLFLSLSHCTDESVCLLFPHNFVFQIYMSMLTGTSTQDEDIRPIHPVQWLSTYGCLSVLLSFSSTCWVSSKEAARTVSKIFGMTQLGFEPPTSQTRLDFRSLHCQNALVMFTLCQPVPFYKLHLYLFYCFSISFQKSFF